MYIKYIWETKCRNQESRHRCTDAVELLRILDTRHAHQQEIDDLDEDHQNIKHISEY